MLSEHNKVINVDPDHFNRQIYRINSETLLKYKPMRNRILVQCLETGIDSVSSVILIPDEYKANIQICKAISCGISTYDINPGDFVLLERANIGFEYDCEGDRYLNVSYKVIMAIYEPDAIEKAKLEGKTYTIPKFRIVVN